MNLKKKPNIIFPIRRGHLELLFKIISFGNPFRPLAMTIGKTTEIVIIEDEYAAIFPIGLSDGLLNGKLLKYA